MEAKNKTRNVFNRLSSKGKEILSNIPKTVSIKLRKPVSEHQRFRQWLDSESKAAALKGRDTYEEFMDFGVDDEPNISSEYELVFDPHSGREVLPREKMFLDAQRKRFDEEQQKLRQKNASVPPPPPKKEDEKPKKISKPSDKKSDPE